MRNSRFDLIAFNLTLQVRLEVIKGAHNFVMRVNPIDQGDVLTKRFARQFKCNFPVRMTDMESTHVRAFDREDMSRSYRSINQCNLMRGGCAGTHGCTQFLYLAFLLPLDWRAFGRTIKGTILFRFLSAIITYLVCQVPQRYVTTSK